MPHRVVLWSVRVLLLSTFWLVPAALPGAPPDSLRKLPTLAAEFERQEALLVTWNADDEGVEEALTAIVSAVYRNLHVIVLIPDDDYLHGAMRCFSLAGVPQNAVRYVRARVDTIWTRDYGPASIRTGDGTRAFIDADYETGIRSHDDQLPTALAPVLGVPTLHVPLTVEGGNLLSNGHGLAISTTKLRAANASRGHSEPEFRELLRNSYGLTEVVFLEPLIGEPTGHVDMFATFVAPHVVVVGQYDRSVDPVNADVLDRNAARLAAVRTPWGRLRVVRVPMPPSGPTVWRTYTNVLYANGTLLVPSYPGITPEAEEQALDTFQLLLPHWRIVPVDCHQLIGLGGGVHCVTLNISHVGRLPRMIDPREIPELRGVFPGDEAVPGELLPGRPWQLAGNADHSQVTGDTAFEERPPLEIDEAVILPTADEFDLADECGQCCPTPAGPVLTHEETRGAGEIVRGSSPQDRSDLTIVNEQAGESDRHAEFFATPGHRSPRGGAMFGPDAAGQPLSEPEEEPGPRRRSDWHATPSPRAQDTLPDSSTWPALPGGTWRRRPAAAWHAGRRRTGRHSPDAAADFVVPVQSRAADDPAAGDSEPGASWRPAVHQLD
jgi:agmatine/peptidylarginine deiminase